MEEILHHPTCMKPCKKWNIYHISWCRISSINSMSLNWPDVFVECLFSFQSPISIPSTRLKKQENGHGYLISVMSAPSHFPTQMTSKLLFQWPTPQIKPSNLVEFIKVWNRWPGARLYGGWVDSWFLTKKKQGVFLRVCWKPLFNN